MRMSQRRRMRMKQTILLSLMTETPFIFTSKERHMDHCLEHIYIDFHYLISSHVTACLYLHIIHNIGKLSVSVCRVKAPNSGLYLLSKDRFGSAVVYFACYNTFIKPHLYNLMDFPTFLSITLIQTLMLNLINYFFFFCKQFLSGNSGYFYMDI